MFSSPTSSALHLLSTISAEAMTLGVLQCNGDVRLRPVPAGVPAIATEQCTLVFSSEMILYEPSMVGSEADGGCIVTLHEVVDEHFFDLDLVILSGSVSDDFDNVVEVKKIQKKNSSTNPRHNRKTRCFQTVGRPG